MDSIARYGSHREAGREYPRIADVGADAPNVARRSVRLGGAKGNAEAPVYELTVAKGGAKVKQTPEGGCVPLESSG